MSNFTKRKQKKQSKLFLIIALVGIALIGATAFVYFRSDKSSDRGLREDKKLPASTIQLHQWLKDNPNDIVNGGVDMGENNTNAQNISQDNVTRIFNNTSFANLQQATPGLHVTTMYFYLDLEDKPQDGIYYYTFSLFLDSPTIKINGKDDTVQYKAFVTLMLNIKDNKIANCTLKDGSKNPKTVELQSLKSMIGIQFTTIFRRDNTSVSVSVKDVTDPSSPRADSRLDFNPLLLDGETMSFPETVRSLTFSSQNSVSIEGEQTISVRALQLTKSSNPRPL